MGMKEAFSRGFNKCLSKRSMHAVSFRILKRQNFEEASREGLVDPIRAINACNPLIPTETTPIVRVYTISEGRNKVARFAVVHGMQNEYELVEVDYSFIALRNLLDIDIGWGLTFLSLK